MKFNKALALGLSTGVLFNNTPVNSFANYNNGISNIKETKTDSTMEWIEDVTSFNRAIGSTVSVVDNKIYVMGEMDSSGFSSSSFHVYDIEENSWEDKGFDIRSLYNADSVVVGDKIYLLGGYEDFSLLNSVDVYDTKTGVWEKNKTTIPDKSGSVKAVSIGNKIYIFGRYSSSNSKNIQVYDTVNDSWELKTTIPDNVPEYTDIEVVNGKLYCFYMNQYEETQFLDVYDPESDSWEDRTMTQTNRSGHSIAVLNDKIYILGGQPDYPQVNITDVEEYDTVADTWRVVTQMPNPRYALETAVVGNKIYCIGGMDDSSRDINSVDVLHIKEKSLEEKAEDAVVKAEELLNEESLVYARSLVNSLSESEKKNELQSRLNTIIPQVTLLRKSSTANVDVYIKSENMLRMTLSTNSITFEDYSGVDDIEMPNSIEISINSSLPYQLNSYLVSEIQNANGSSKIEKDLLNIKINDDLDYKTFDDINEKLVLKDNCDAGNDKTHSIDLMLKGGDAHEADVYKTVIKFEAEQK